MAEIRPFKGIYYDASKVEIQKVVTEPWDVITPETQQSYYDADPRNIVRVIRGKEMTGDDETENKFVRAGKYFRMWLEEGFLVQDSEDSIYVYTQTFLSGGSEFTRRGFIAAVRLEDYESKIILPHEHTFPKHNANRLHLIHETKANFGKIFMLYPDPEMTIPRFLSRYDSATPLMSVAINGITHSIIRLTDPEEIKFIVEQMREKQLFIADGHHRYQTALNYRDEMRPKLSEEGRQAIDYRMMALVSMDDPSVTILPTNRVIRGIANFQQGQVLEQLKEFFDVKKLEYPASELQVMLGKLRDLAPVAAAFVVCLPGGDFFLIRSNDKASLANALSGNLHPAVRELDLTVLHSLILEKMLSLSLELQRSGEHITYFRNPAEAVGMVERGEAQAAFLVNPTGVHQVRDVALAGQVMPQKSTDFYPKLLTGLIMRKLEI